MKTFKTTNGYRLWASFSPAPQSPIFATSSRTPHWFLLVINRPAGVSRIGDRTNSEYWFLLVLPFLFRQRKGRDGALGGTDTEPPFRPELTLHQKPRGRADGTTANPFLPNGKKGRPPTRAQGAICCKCRLGGISLCLLSLFPKRK